MRLEESGQIVAEISHQESSEDIDITDYVTRLISENKIEPDGPYLGVDLVQDELTIKPDDNRSLVLTSLTLFYEDGALEDLDANGYLLSK